MLKGVVIDDTQLFNDKLAEWETFYNYHRPHGGLGGQTPYEGLRQKTQTQAVTDERQSHRRTEPRKPQRSSTLLPEASKPPACSWRPVISHHPRPSERYSHRTPAIDSSRAQSR